MRRAVFKVELWGIPLIICTSAGLWGISLITCTRLELSEIPLITCTRLELSEIPLITCTSAELRNYQFFDYFFLLDYLSFLCYTYVINRTVTAHILSVNFSCYPLDVLIFLLYSTWKISPSISRHNFCFFVLFFRLFYWRFIRNILIKFFTFSIINYVLFSSSGMSCQKQDIINNTVQVSGSSCTS